MIKKRPLLLLTLLLVTISFQAQNRQNTLRKIKALKVNYITTELNLSPKEAEKFWPIYNEYEKSKRTIRYKEIQKIKSKIKSYDSVKNIPEADALKLQEEFFLVEEKYLNNKRNYFNQLIDAIGIHKVLKLNLAEQSFNSTMLKQFGKKRKKNKQQN